MGKVKIVAKQIEMVAWFDKKGVPKPVRFRIQNEDESYRVIKIDKVVTMDKEKLAGNEMLVFKCQSIIEGVMSIFEIKYELKTCKWILYKI
ncbi:MAG: hypothetical protein ACI8WT_004540 [Clostridium sp.]